MEERERVKNLKPTINPTIVLYIDTPFQKRLLIRFLSHFKPFLLRGRVGFCSQIDANKTFFLES